MTSEHAPHDTRELLVILTFVIHKDARDVARIVELPHRAERYYDHGVVVIVASLHFMLVSADDLKADAIDSDALAQSLLAREKSSLRFIADNRYASVLRHVLLA